MNAKEQKIKEAYEYLEIEGLCPNENGWSIYKHEITEQLKEIVDYKPEICTDINENDSTRLLIRPKPLQGIEDNNGWIRIYSESDLPKDLGLKYNVCILSNNDSFYTNDESYDFQDVANLYVISKITHYQTIEKRIQPVY